MLKHFWLFGALATVCILTQFFYSLGHAPEKVLAKDHALQSALAMSFILLAASSAAFIFLAAQRRHPKIQGKVASAPMLASFVVSLFALSVTSAVNGAILVAGVSLAIAILFALRYLLALEQAYPPSVPPPRLHNALVALGLCIAIPICWALAR